MRLPRRSAGDDRSPLRPRISRHSDRPRAPVTHARKCLRTARRARSPVAPPSEFDACGTGARRSANNKPPWSRGVADALQGAPELLHTPPYFGSSIPGTFSDSTSSGRYFRTEPASLAQQVHIAGAALQSLFAHLLAGQLSKRLAGCADREQKRHARSLAAIVWRRSSSSRKAAVARRPGYSDDRGKMSKFRNRVAMKSIELLTLFST